MELWARNLIKCAIGIALLAVAVGCAVNPVTGKQELALLGSSWEIATGERNYAPMRRAGGGICAVSRTLCCPPTQRPARFQL